MLARFCSVRARLLLKLDDAAVRVQRNDAETMGFMAADAADGDGHRRAGAHMMGKKRLVVHQIDMFAGEDQYALLFLLE